MTIAKTRGTTADRAAAFITQVRKAYLDATASH